MIYLLDTCVISEFVAREPNPRVLDWIDSREETHLYLSVITVGEIRKGIEMLPQSRRSSELGAWLNDQILPRFSDRIVPIDANVMLRWGELVCTLQKQGKNLPAIDSLIAASALQANLILVTRNESDFADCGVSIVNPWR